MAKKLQTTKSLSFDEALENLNSMAAIDLHNPPPLSIVSSRKFQFAEIDSSVKWLSGEGEDPVLEVVDSTYRTIYEYLIQLVQQEGLDEKLATSLMALVSDSAQKMERYLTERLGHPLSKKISERESYLSLKQFYRDWVAETKEKGQEIESIRRDHDYELFLLRKEDGTPYFDIELIRNVKMVVGFEGGDLDEDPLLRVRSLVDRDAQASAAQILHESAPWIKKYYSLPLDLRKNPLAEKIGMTILALFLAANPKNLIQNTTGKSSLQYFNDFHEFLRQSFQTETYQHQIAYSPDTAKEAVSLHLAHSLCHSLFFRLGGIKTEALGLIHRIMHRGEKGQKVHSGDTHWNQFLLDDDAFRTALSHFPNGPLFKTLDLIREGGEEFDPLTQECRPMRLFRISKRVKEIDCLRLPSPTRQMSIDFAQVSDEFKGFLRSLAEQNPAGRHLLFQLQDRTSWKEEGRCHALEEFAKNAEIAKQFLLFTLPKNGEFYSQTGNFFDIEEASLFIAAFKKQFQSHHWLFNAPLGWKEASSFIDRALPILHKTCFNSASTLSRRDREDFIEIFYHFFALHTIDLIHPTSISFTCKDGIDTGAAATAFFFVFLKLFFEGKFTSREDHDFLRLLLYVPALFVRERAIDAERFTRQLSAMEKLSFSIEKVKKEMAHLYSAGLLEGVKVDPFLRSLK